MARSRGMWPYGLQQWYVELSPVSLTVASCGHEGRAYATLNSLSSPSDRQLKHFLS